MAEDGDRRWRGVFPAGAGDSAAVGKLGDAGVNPVLGGRPSN